MDCMANTKLIFRFLMFWLMLSLTGHGYAAQSAGKVKLAVGDVTAQLDGGPERSLKIGAEVFDGDVVTTREKGFAVIIMDDESRFTIKPNSQLEIVESGASSGDNSVLTKLVQGGMKVITGQIAKRDPNRFRIDTPLGSIGVRGTSFDEIGRASCRERV